MKLLALDCAQRLCAVALYDAGSGEVLARLDPEIGRGHAERLPALVDEVLAEAGVAFADIDRIAVTIGPGSFAGIRVGVAFARGLALALKIPAVGVSGLYAMAGPCARDAGLPVMATIDARRDRIWAAVVGPDGATLAEPAELTAVAAAELASRIPAVIVGDAAPLVLAEDASLSIMSGGPFADIAEVARIGAELDPAVSAAEPAYLRAPDAKPQAGFAVERLKA
ncbi:tRNA (adenosine(37)-N6)-threonylcarbamoyltransferase complex dimerization subunit type 1 TsaB [Pseudohoeflea suaedae]|uniref:N(6)-L-threonylcarbamoyladenine synthase n=1 Tax=Pseudohoeflea suaedae TaxID=877384 RepID=A0A4R5PM31_9HYPH|nr:tRNA (adenosine(37)-N6)-threonylcarbamoyltransferase complex dimerization subunit type 1 TsaB [Pseudohoeflea suaedae]TDH38006.1 tRNA (adenosine(37)-N6)-threonylcarbamoyltransferase complex dimerization subunit type 1 TsaB [Pseudohoeflea suaedae]